jgi:diguanylate cyclase (GGDEF)-like protein
VHAKLALLVYEAAIAIMLVLVTVSPETPPESGRLTLLTTTFLVAGSTATAAWYGTRSLMRAQTALETLALQDPLTELWNRRAFELRYTRLADIASRTGESFSLAMIDLDHFKAINDRFGHPAGDAVLRRAAHVLSTGVRATDEVFRVGGEEFTILFPETHVDEGTRIVERIRHTMETDTSNPAVITFSAGVIAGHDKSAIEHADALLLEAKTAGRNRVRSASLTPS